MRVRQGIGAVCVGLAGAVTVACSGAPAPVTARSTLPSSAAASAHHAPTPPPSRERPQGAPSIAAAGEVAPDLERLAERFVAYAVGETRSFPHAAGVDVSSGGSPAARLDGEALADGDAWRVCPEGWDGYAAAGCPVDLLGPLRAARVNGSRLVLEPGLTDVTCSPTRTGPLPAGHLVVLRPVPAQRTCASDFALVLVADGRGRLIGVDLTLSTP